MPRVPARLDRSGSGEDGTGEELDLMGEGSFAEVVVGVTSTNDEGDGKGDVSRESDCANGRCSTGSSRVLLLPTLPSTEPDFDPGGDPLLPLLLPLTGRLSPTGLVKGNEMLGLAFALSLLPPNPNMPGLPGLLGFRWEDVEFEVGKETGIEISLECDEVVSSPSSASGW